MEIRAKSGNVDGNHRSILHLLAKNLFCELLERLKSTLGRSLAAILSWKNLSNIKCYNPG